MRLLAELDERQVRLGYVNAVVLAAGRQLDTRAALRRRFDQFIFRRINEGSDMNAFLDEIDADGLQALEHQDKQREKHRAGANARRDMMAALRREPAAGRFRFAGHLWLLQRCMPSHLGPLAPERSEVFLEHAKHLGLLAETYALTELGHVLNEFLAPQAASLVEGRPTPNPLFVGARLGLRAIYAWALLENDVLTPFLLREFLLRRHNDPHLLVAAVDSLLFEFERGARIDSARELKRLRDYRTRVAPGTELIPADSKALQELKREYASVLDEPTRRMEIELTFAERARKEHGATARTQRVVRQKRATDLQGFMDRRAAPSTGFKVHRHHVRPRLEHYVDVGLLGRHDDPHATETAYDATSATERAVMGWAPLLHDPRSLQRFLNTSFFASAAAIFEVRPARPCSTAEALLYFAEGFAMVGREIGFTPGRTVALAGCVLALEQGLVCEIETMFQAVRDSARTDIGEHLIFSGGSRLDGQFLIRVKPEMIPALQGRLTSPGAPRKADHDHA